MIFNDAYRVRTLAQSAALHVADAISRSTTILTEDYLEGMNDVYDFLLAEQQTSRLRINLCGLGSRCPTARWCFGPTARAA